MNRPRMNRSRALANQQRQAQSLRFGRLRRSALMLCATALSFATIILLAADQLYRPDTFQLDHLKITGRFRYLQPQQIEQIVQQQRLGNFFSVELDQIKQRVEKLAWVQTAEIRRVWPDTLLIQVTEQKPLMRWNTDRWVNTVGDVIDLPGAVTLSDPVVLSGNAKDARLLLRQAIVWKQRLATRQIRLQGLTLSNSHAYRLQLEHQNNQFELLLGRDQVEQRLQRFERLFEQQFRYSNQRLHRVDARYPDGLAVAADNAIEADSSANNEATVGFLAGNR